MAAAGETFRAWLIWQPSMHSTQRLSPLPGSSSCAVTSVMMKPPPLSAIAHGKGFSSSAAASISFTNDSASRCTSAADSMTPALSMLPMLRPSE